MRRKEFIVLAVLLALASGSAQGQESAMEWKLDTLGVSSGESPIASGITGFVDLRKGHQWIEVAVQQEQAWFIYGRKFNFWHIDTTLGVDVGHLQGAVWGGPYLTMSRPIYWIISVDTIIWPGIFASDPHGYTGRPPSNAESIRAGTLVGGQLNIGPVGLGYAGLNYLDEPWNRLPGMSFTQKLDTHFKVSASLTRNTNAKMWMYFVGITWKPKQ